MQTTHLALPLLAPAQAQKHVTHNEALSALDALVQLAVLDRHRAAPPTSPAAGDRHIVGSIAIGAWAGREGAVALFEDGLWRFFPPSRGWLAFDLAEGKLLAFDGAAWGDALSAVDAVSLERLGIGTEASAANPLAAKLNDALLVARGVGEGGSGSLRVKLSKENAAAVLSLLFQSGYEARAEIGLVGNDDLSVKVSGDGASWREAIAVERATGLVRFPAGAVTEGRRNLLRNGAFAVNQRGHPSGAALAAGVYGHDGWKAGADGAAYTVAAGTPDMVVTITAGTLCQVVEGTLVSGGALTLSWAGSAPGRVGAGALSPSPITIEEVLPGTALTVAFGPGTLGGVQLEEGRAATGFERRADEAQLCRRHLWRRAGAGAVIGPGQAVSATSAVVPLPFAVPLRASPDLTFAGLELLGADGSALPATALVAAAAPDGAALTLTVAGGLAPGHATLLRLAGPASFVQASAEL